MSNTSTIPLIIVVITAIVAIIYSFLGIFINDKKKKIIITAIISIIALIIYLLT